MTTNPPRRRRITDMENLTVGQEYWVVPRYPDTRNQGEAHKMTVRSKIPGGYKVYAHGFKRPNQSRTYETLKLTYSVYELRAPPEPEVEVQTPKTVDPTALVRIEDGGVWTTSVVVAQALDVRHDNVLRTVDNMKCSTTFQRLNIEEVEIPYRNASGEQKRRIYRFTRNGFCMVVFGLKSEKAWAWKEKFLTAFNAMEAELRKRQGPEYAVAGQAAAIEKALKEQRRELVTAVAEVVKDGLANNVYQTPTAWLEDNTDVDSDALKEIFELWVDYRSSELGIGGRLNEYTPEVISGRYDEIAGTAGLTSIANRWLLPGYDADNLLLRMASSRVARNKFACEVDQKK